MLTNVFQKRTLFKCSFEKGRPVQSNSFAFDLHLYATVKLVVNPT